MYFSEIHILKPNPQSSNGGAFGRYLDGALMNEINNLIKMPWKDLLPLPPCEDTRRNVQTKKVYLTMPVH